MLKLDVHSRHVFTSYHMHANCQHVFKARCGVGLRCACHTGLLGPSGSSVQDPLDPLPLDSGSLPPVQDPGAQLAPFTTLQLPLEPPSKNQSTIRHSTWLLSSLCPKHYYTGAVPPKVLPAV